MRKIHDSTCSVIPPHILRHVAEHGDDEDRATIASTIASTVQFTQQRTAALIDIPMASSTNTRKQRAVYDAGNNVILPGMLVMEEDKPGSGDVEVREAFAGSGATYDFYARVFLRNSIDDRGMRLDSTVHYGQRFSNALWNGKQMIYGDGDGKLFTRFTAAVEVIGHELTHGVTQNEAALEYHGQSGALNEHISDAFGIMVKQYLLAQTSMQSDWLIGARLLGPNVQGIAIRSMKAPGTAYDDPILGRDPQPSHMRRYVHSAQDDGGVHINSGIPNRAFYLVSVALGGYSWRVAGQIWYRALTRGLFPKAGFQDFANATVTAAGQLFGIGSHVQATVADAWAAVGLPVPPSLTTSATGGAMRSQQWRDRPEAPCV